MNALLKTTPLTQWVDVRRFVKVLCLSAAVSLPLVAQTVDPCVQNTQLTGGTTFTSNSSGNRNLSGSPYGYEMWTQGGNNNRLTWYGTTQGGGAAFRAEWTNPNDYLGRVGYYWGNGGPYTQYKNIYCDYNYTRSGRNTGGNYSYIGIYGWTRNPLVEYYIVEDWYGNQWQTDTSPITTSTTGGSVKGSFTIDGALYDIIQNQRVNQSSIDGTKTFTQIFSVRRTPRQCGTISVTEHFKKWEELDLPFGDRMYECKFLVEAGGGTGWFEASYLTFTQEDQPRGSSSEHTPAVSASPELYVTVLPNSGVNVNFIATENGETELKLYSLTGGLIASTELQTIDGKNYSHTFNQGKLPIGFYMVWMHSNGSIEQAKVVIPK